MAIVKVEVTPEQLASFRSATPNGRSRTMTNWTALFDDQIHGWTPDAGTPDDKVTQKRMFFTELLRRHAKRAGKIVLLDWNKEEKVLKFMTSDPITDEDRAFLAKPEWKPKSKEEKEAAAAAKAMASVAQPNVNESEEDSTLPAEEGSGVNLGEELPSEQPQEQPVETEVPPTVTHKPNGKKKGKPAQLAQ